MMFICLSSPLLAQSNRSIHLLVSDSLSGEPLQGAAITLSKHHHFHITDERGEAEVDSLPSGDIVLHVSYVGYHHQDVYLKAFTRGVVKVQMCSENYHLHETLVEASGNTKSISGRTKDYLSAEEITKRQGQNLADILQQINGVTVLNSAGGIAKPVVRGLSGQRLVTLQGNGRVEGQQWGDDHAPEMDPFQAASIELIKGAAAVEYGPEAIGGVIRSNPLPWKNEKGISGKVFLNAFSNNRQAAGSVLVEQRIGEKKYWAWRAQLSGRRAGDARAPDYVLSNTAFAENAQNITLLRATPTWQWESTLNRYATQQAILAASHLGNLNDLKSALQSPQPLIVLPFTYQIGRPYQDVTHVMLQSSFTYKPNGRNVLKMVYVQQVNRRKEFDADRVYTAALQGLPAMDLEIQSIGSDLTWENKWNAHFTLKGGASLQYQYNTIAGLQFIIPPYQSYSGGLFGILKYHNAKSDVGFGLRADYKKLEVLPFKRNNKTLQYQREFNGYTASFNYNRNLRSNVLLSLGLQSAWRPPAVNELYSYGLHYGIANFEMGDSSLHPETNLMLELGLKFPFRTWMLAANVYANRFNNFIYKTPLAEPILTIRGAFPAFQFTQEDALFVGAEYSMERRPQVGITWLSNYSFLHTQTLQNAEPIFGMPANRMQHNLGYAFRRLGRMHKPWVELQSKWVARQNRFVAHVDFRDPPPAYVLFHLHAGFEMNVGKQKNTLVISASIQNILNQHYRDYQSRFRYFTDDPGINFIIRMNYTF